MSAPVSPLSADIGLPGSVAIVGAGPAGLTAAEVLAAGGARVHHYDAMPSAGRKFLLAGRGGLNLTHSEPLHAFVARYRERAPQMQSLLAAFGPDDLRQWARGLGISTFVGSSGRVFPTDLKAAPLLRAWLHRLRAARACSSICDTAGRAGAPSPTASTRRAHPRRHCAALRHGAGAEDRARGRRACSLSVAAAGRTWARMARGPRGLRSATYRVAPLRPSNCGFDVRRTAPDGTPTNGWSDVSQRFAGHPLKTVGLGFDGTQGRAFRARGEFVVTDGGVEGSLVYAASAVLREQIAAEGRRTCGIDLLPGRTEDAVFDEVAATARFAFALDPPEEPARAWKA